MKREIQQPTTNERGAESHPAWAMIGASRVTSTPGAILFDSDVRHGHYIVLTLSRASRQRSLQHDYNHPREEIVEVAMSEAQWASFVSSMNSGSGVPATLLFDRTQENPMVPGMPFQPRLAESLKEVRVAADEAVAEVREAFEAYKERKTKDTLRTLQARIDNLPANIRFASESLSGHAEAVVTRAKADIEAYVIAKARQLEIDPAEIATLELGAGPGEGDES